MNGITRDAQGFFLLLDTSVYSLDAIKRTAYKFADRTSTIISPESGALVKVAFNFAGQHAQNDQEQVVAKFCNELLDQDLREIVQRETTPLRNLILAHAFSRTPLADKP
jgi:His-Xaa-Ser system protein HxsD